ncbi:uncharacterized protein, partial [Clytia hemisphaerica]|uniref:uncharacterized protein n=1 Tax=Clytia hemisphaerica TaxID=252671 RepID=UPI0034D4ACD2
MVFPYEIKEKQFDAVYNIVRGKDTLCVFPTGFGKSLIYQIIPNLAKELYLAASPLVIVISPLVALIKDQIYEANQSPLNLKPCAAQEHQSEALKQYNIIFGTPEIWLNHNSSAQKFLKSTFAKKNLMCLVVDEVHKVT